MLTQSDAYFFVNIFKGGGYRHLSNTYRLYGKCIGDGSVLKSKLKRPVSVRTPQNVGAVRAVLLRSLVKLTRKAAAELGIYRRSVQRKF